MMKKTILFVGIFALAFAATAPKVGQREHTLDFIELSQRILKICFNFSEFQFYYFFN
jgi:hypothetical protein